MTAHTTARGAADSTVRRVVDVVVAIVVGIAVLPVFIVVAVAVSVSLGRPVLFRQVRSGKHGAPFTVLKFRTMRPARSPYESDTDRTPRFGSILRSSSLDELPQLWNILRGDMSVIGPRPTLPEQVARYGDHERGRLAVRPGVTGWAQVNGRNAISWETRIELDLWYVANRSAALDLRILGRTVLRLIRPQGVVGAGGVNPDFIGSAATDPVAAAPVPPVPVAMDGGGPDAAGSARTTRPVRRSVRFVVIAGESAGIGALKLVHESGHDVVCAVAESDEMAMSALGTSVADAARAMGVEVIPACRVTDEGFGDRLRDARVDVLLNVHSLRILAPDVLAAPRIGSFNLHPGPLPEYAGLNVPSWAVLHGRREHGATLHWMTSTVDAGAVAFAATFPITATDTGGSVFARSVREGLPLVGDLVQCLSEGRDIPANEQDLSLRRYHGRAAPRGGWIPWSATAQEVVCLVRACDYTPWRSPWGPAMTLVDARPLAALRVAGRSGFEIEVARAALTGAPTAGADPGSIGQVGPDGVHVAAADEWVLVRRVRLAGRSVPTASVLLPGQHLTPEPLVAAGTRSIRC